jgi:pimeloyl-ACP methyl ester carboxylesterase
MVVFGGYDSYVEEWFPLLEALRDAGFDVVAFEGPGQGSVLEEQGAAMTHEWHRPVGAVLDAFGLDDVTLVGVSLGGCLVIRAAAFEPRVKRVVAFDVLTDFTECMFGTQPRAVAGIARGLLALHADDVFDGAVSAAAPKRPVMEWGLAQALHVFGCAHPAEAFRAASHYVTKDISHRLEQDVLLLAGAEDHYVPLHQLGDQAASLTSARSVTTRIFTRRDHAHAHCQVGNFPLAVQVMSSWFDTVSKRGG